MAGQPQILSETVSAQMVERALDGQRRRVRGLEAWRMYLVAWVPVLLVPLLVVLLDHNLAKGLPDAVILWVGRIWLIAAPLALLGLRAWLARRTPNRLFLAQDLEQTYGIRHNMLVNTVQISADDDANYAEPVARSQTAAALQTAELVRSAAPQLRRRAFPLLLVLGIWVLYAVLGPKSIWPSLARFFGLGGLAPTATQLEWIRPQADEDLYLDRPLEIVVATSGRPVREVRLERFAAGEEPVFSCQLQRSKADTATRLWRVKLAPHELAPAFRYRITAGDATLTGTLTILEPVQVSAWEVQLEPPPYIGSPPSTIEGNEIMAWAGTRATFHLRANAPIRDPIFVLKTEQTETRTRMNVDPTDPTHATYEQVLDASGTFRAVFRDVQGRSALPVPPGRLTVRSDRPPMVGILKPTPEEVATRLDVTNMPRILVRAVDDVGLTRFEYVVERDGRSERKPVLESTLRRMAEVDWALDVIPLAYDETVRLWFEVSDNRPDPQTARSRALVLTRSRPLEPPPGAAGGGSGEGESGDGDGDAAGEGAGGGGATGDGSGTEGGAGDGPGPGDQPGSSSDPSGGGPGEAPGSTEGPVGEASVGEGNLEGDGQPDVEGPGGMGADDQGGSYDEALDDFVEEFGDELEELQEQMEQGDPPPAPETPSDPEMDPQEPETESDPRSDPPATEEAAQESDGQPAEVDEQPQDSEGEELTEEGGDSEPQEGETEPSEREAVEELLAAAEPPSEEDLAEVGMDPAQAQAFLTALERLQDLKALSPVSGETREMDVAPLPEAADDGSAGLAGTVGLGVGPGARLEDRLGRIVAPADQVVPGDLEALLDAYYRAMAELRPAEVAED